MYSPSLPHLLERRSLLFDHADVIVRLWLSDDLVNEVLLRHDIEKDRFAVEYANGILNYFFNIVAGTQHLGRCPVINDLLTYLKAHDIAADELFVICTHAKEAMISVTYTLGINTKALTDEINHIFDRNFKGVLNQYANTIYRLERQVEEEVRKNREKDALMFQQARLAAMGEMINNIAHQWRQPLSMISVLNQSVLIKHRLDILSDVFLTESIDRSQLLIRQMSQTINDFHDFFRPQKAKERFLVDDAISQALALIGKSLEHEQIEIITDFGESEPILSFENEFTHVLINIINNAQDELARVSATTRRLIKIKSRQLRCEAPPCIRIHIQDSAGGIADEIIEKVFDPYFTTKEQGKGTGIGLYMSKQIIENNMDGRMRARNNSFEHKGAIHTGAEFILDLPLE